MQAFGRGKAETTEGVEDVSRINAGIRRGDGVRLAPEGLAFLDPGSFGLAQTLKLLTRVIHRQHDATHQVSLSVAVPPG